MFLPLKMHFGGMIIKKVLRERAFNFFKFYTLQHPVNLISSPLNLPLSTITQFILQLHILMSNVCNVNCPLLMISWSTLALLTYEAFFSISLS